MTAGLAVVPHSDDPWSAILSDLSLPISLLSGVHTVEDHDGWRNPQWTRLAGDAGWQINVESTLWKSASVTLQKVGRALELGVRVEGKGRIQSVSFLEGALAEQVPPPAATSRLVRRNPLLPRHYGLASPVEHRRVFSPQPESRTGPWYEPEDTVPLTVACTFGPDRFDTFFSPGIWCFVLDLGPKKGFLSVGLLAEASTQHFHTFEYRGGAHFGFGLVYDGMMEVDGEFHSPRLRLARAESPESALEDYVGHLRQTGLAPVPQRAIPAWWRRPIFCGWGSQVAWGRLARDKKTRVFEQGAIDDSAEGFATQENYEEMVRLLEKHDLPYGTLIIDLGWSKAPSLPEVNTAKWPDLPGFIRGQHAKGKKVLLWLGCWQALNMPPDCLMDADPGAPKICDPTKPEYRERLKAAISRVIGPEIDADGFKIDFSAIPKPAGLRPARQVWGVALLRDYIQLIYETAKAAKPDAMIVTHCANPAFGDITDVLRLNDLFFDQLDITGPMAFRARMARIACPEWLIDTDGDPFSSPESWRQYQLFQPQIGIPSLYNLTHTSGTVQPIPEEWVAEVAAVWRAYIEELSPERGEG